MPGICIAARSSASPLSGVNCELSEPSELSPVPLFASFALFAIPCTAKNRSAGLPPVSLRNHLQAHPAEFDFDFFYATFGAYVDPKESRDGIDVINEMERQLNRLVQADHAKLLLNPYEAKTTLLKWKRDARAALATEQRLAVIRELVARVSDHVNKHRTAAPVIVEKEA
jgi:hypothetical protein